MTQKENKKIKLWNTITAILDNLYPKGKSKDRGKALVFLAYIWMAISGIEFDENGKPKRK